jgi:hypothetical protein
VKPYDWLNTHDILNEQIDAALALANIASPHILHIGCGNSELSFDLRFKVRDPEQIQNIDYSSVAISWGRQREMTMFDSRWKEDNEDAKSIAPDYRMPMMRWTEVDLLSIQSVISTCALEAYSIIVDKSTSDSLACTSTTEVFLPYFLYTDKDEGDASLNLLTSISTTASTLQILAVHLALLARPGARWVVYSYSSTRFDFLKNNHHINEDVPTVLKMNARMPHPGHLWDLIESKTVAKPYLDADAPEETTATQAGRNHFIYVLERTDEPLRVRTT